jgi:hypothetical protein
MNKKKIIFLLNHPFNKRDYNRFGIDLLIKNGFDIEAWDFTPFLFPKVYMNYVPDDKYVFDGLKIFFFKCEALKSLAKLNNRDIIVLYISNSFHTYSIFKTLSNNNVYFGFSTQNTIPALPPKISFVKKFISNRKFLHEAIYNRIPSKLLGIRNPNFIIAGGRGSINDENQLLDTKLSIIWTHSLDYDIFLSNESQINNVSNRTISKGYVLFLDEYQPFHSDYLYQKNPPKIDPIVYYRELDLLFALIEKKENCEVVIAAHPRSQYDKHPDYFKGRKCIKGETINLVKNSNYVILHMSTSISFAVLYNKPLVFIKSSIIEEWYGPTIDFMAKLFSKFPISIDKKYTYSEIKKNLKIQLNDYINYKEVYIKSPNSENIMSWQIFSNHINSKFKF